MPEFIVSPGWHLWKALTFQSPWAGDRRGIGGKPNATGNRRAAHEPVGAPDKRNEILAPKERQARGKQFFFEKKNQKTFVSCPRQRVQPGRTDAVLIDKSFLVLFFKKELLPCWPLMECMGLFRIPKARGRKQFFFEKKNQKTFFY